LASTSCRPLTSPASAVFVVLKAIKDSFFCGV
jgi:hypothetical protein